MLIIFCRRVYGLVQPSPVPPLILRSTLISSLRRFLATAGPSVTMKEMAESPAEPAPDELANSRRSVNQKKSGVMACPSVPLFLN